jgi:hypothetical protein
MKEHIKINSYHIRIVPWMRMVKTDSLRESETLDVTSPPMNSDASNDDTPSSHNSVSMRFVLKLFNAAKRKFLQRSSKVAVEVKTEEESACAMEMSFSLHILYGHSRPGPLHVE